MADERPYQPRSTASVRPQGIVQPVVRKVLPPVSEAERIRITETIAILKEKVPEVVTMVKEMHALGMIDGWRAVTITKEK